MTEKDYVQELTGIFMIILVIQAILFSFFHKLGIILVLGLFVYFMIFMSKDKKMKKEELDRLLHHEKSWIDYKIKLSKQIP
jgi:hypothetical protein